MSDIMSMKDEIRKEAEELIESMDAEHIVLSIMKADDKITNICNIFNELEEEVYSRGTKEEYRKLKELREDG